MEIETEISTPEDVDIVDTSIDVEPTDVEDTDVDTSIVEPTEPIEPAETETETALQEVAPEKLYANKYKSIEELEKGYNEASKFVQKSAELEKELNAIKQKQTEELLKAQAQQLNEAKQRGFNTTEDYQIAQALVHSEAQLYYNNLNGVDESVREDVKQLLEMYNATGNKEYLDVVKPYFPYFVHENAIMQKSRYEGQLREQLTLQQNTQKEQQAQELANILKADFAEFLGDLNDNQGKSKALQMFCNADFIQSKEDMEDFCKIYKQIADFERAQALKELEAQKTIENAKKRAVINSGTGAIKADVGLKDSYTAADIGAMSQDEYNALCDKYGEDEITRRLI